MNASNRTVLEKILKAIDYIEPIETRVVRYDVSREEVE